MLRRILSKKPLVRIGIVFLLLIAIFYAEENWRGRRAWNAYCAAAAKRGVKLLIEDFVTADLPDEQNYAAVPVIRDLFVKAKGEGDSPNPLRLPVSSGRMPEPPNDMMGRRFDFAKWQQFFLSVKLIGKKSDSAAGDILGALEKYEPVLRQLREAASRPKCKFPTHWEDGYTTSLPHFSFVMAASRIFCLRARAHLQLGDSPSAFTELWQNLRIYDACRSELSLIAGLVRIAVISTAEGVIWDGLVAGQWRDEELAALEKQFASLRIGDDWRFAFMTERAFVNTALRTQVERSDSELVRETQANHDCGEEAYFSKWFVIHFFPRGWMYRSMIRTDEYFEWLIARCKGADGESPPAVFPTYEASQHWFRTHPDHFGVIAFDQVFVMQSQLVFDTAYRRYLYTQVRVQEVRLACALERFRLSNRAFPLKLEQLVPECLPLLPTDPFDGKALRYRRNDDGGYDVWSIGSNGKDDGGKIAPEQQRESQADWIWHMPGPTGAR